MWVYWWVIPVGLVVLFVAWVVIKSLFADEEKESRDFRKKF